MHGQRVSVCVCVCVAALRMAYNSLALTAAAVCATQQGAGTIGLTAILCPPHPHLIPEHVRVLGS